MLFGVRDRNNYMFKLLFVEILGHTLSGPSYVIIGMLETLNIIFTLLERSLLITGAVSVLLLFKVIK